MVRGLRHAYGAGPDAEVLHGIDLELAPGERVAVVGASGAGKTTLGTLVAGVRQPSAGQVRLGGAALSDLADLRRHVVLVTQEVHVFAGSVADNLRLARPDATDDELHEVLDEATAEAGSAGARVLEAAAEVALAGRTALVIAHRLTQAVAADRVVVLDRGRWSSPARTTSWSPQVGRTRRSGRRGGTPGPSRGKGFAVPPCRGVVGPSVEGDMGPRGGCRPCRRREHVASWSQ